MRDIEGRGMRGGEVRGREGGGGGLGLGNVCIYTCLFFLNAG